MNNKITTIIADIIAITGFIAVTFSTALAAINIVTI